MKLNSILFPIALFCAIGLLGCGDNLSASQSQSTSYTQAQSVTTIAQTSVSSTTKPVTTITTAATTATTSAITTTTTVTTTTAAAEPDFEIEEKSSYSGIDVSRWQGSNVDFEAVKKSGVEIVYIKAGDNLNEDMYFRQNAENAGEAKLATGFYFYVTAGNTSEATEQALYFSQLLEDVDYQCRPAVDFEAFGNLSAQSINEIALTFAGVVEEQTGIAPIFYTDADNADIWCEELTKYPLWIADYDCNPPFSIGKWEKYSAFQYSCTGVVNGITENVVDLDIFTADVLF